MIELTVTKWNEVNEILKKKLKWSSKNSAQTTYFQTQDEKLQPWCSCHEIVEYSIVKRRKQHFKSEHNIIQNKQ